MIVVEVAALAVLALVCMGLGLLLIQAQRRNAMLAAQREREREEKAQLAQQLAAERAQSKAREEARAQAEQQVRATFAELAGQALRSNNETFLSLAQQNLEKLRQQTKGDLELKEKAVEALVKPIRDKLQQVHQQVQDVEKARAQAYGSLTEQVRALAGSQEKLELATSDLVKVLRQPQQRGRWGEVQLDTVLQTAGLVSGLDFFKQPTTGGDDGRLRPDVVVNLPDGGQLVIDAKAPVDAFLNAYEAKTAEDRDQHLRDHVRLVRNHLAALSSKEYQNQFTPSPEWVVMFVPVESFLTMALVHDSSLIVDSVKQRVILASPITLMAVLTAVASLWKQKRMAEQVEKIGQFGAELYDRLATLAEHFENVGESLRRAIKSHGDAIGSLEGSVLPSARRMKELGAPAKKEMPVLKPIDDVVREIQAKELLGGGKAGEGG